MATVKRRFCVSNLYPIQFVEAQHVCLRISIFRCSFYDAQAEQQVLPREETELKRKIFEVPRRLKCQQSIEEALGVKTLEFGGDCAAGLCVERPWVVPLAREQVVLDEPDRYEVLVNKDWLPCVVRAAAEEFVVELYAPGSFYSEQLGLWGPKRVTLAQLRHRQWEVCRGEVLTIPKGAVMALHPGQRLWVQARGPGHEEPAGRLEMAEGASLRCLGGAVENEGVLACIIAMPHGQRYRLEIEHSKTVLVDCVQGIPDLPAEERHVALQCFGWIFERAYRQMQLRTLGGRGWYQTDQARVLNLGDRSTSPQVFVYKGFMPSTAYIHSGPCLKVDICVRLIQKQTVLARLNYFRDLLNSYHSQQGLRPPSKGEMEAFLQKRMQGRTCMCRHNQVNYRIRKVCIDMDPTDTFPSEEGEISYLEYFQRRHGLTLQRKQPLLYCPFRAKQEVYLPAEIAYLTGLDEEFKQDKDGPSDLWQGLRHLPHEHWTLQEQLMKGLNTVHGGALREWGVEVASKPVRVKFGELPQEPVYFSPEVEKHFQELRQPPAELAVRTGPFGFERPPWPELWLRERIALDRWLLICPSSELQSVEAFLYDLEPLVGELLAQEQRLRVQRPEVVAISAGSAQAWAKKLMAYDPPWPKEHTDFVLLAIPHVRRRDAYYYQLKSLLTFHWDHCCPSQLVLAATLRKHAQRTQVLQNILQQILVKKGASLWVLNPLPYVGRSLMVLGFDTAKATKDAPLFQALSASYNVYLTSYFSTWRKGEGHTTCPAPLLLEALEYFYQRMRRLPDTLVIYRGGCSESQEAALLEHELHHPSDGFLAALDRLAEAEGLQEWRSKVAVAYIMARRSVTARFMTEDGNNLPSGSFVDEEVMPGKPSEDPRRYDFYMVSQTYVVGTARPTLYSVLYNSLSFSKQEVIQLTHRLCGAYMTFAGMVALPAPLKYAGKLLSLLSKCQQVPEEPIGALRPWRPNLFFI